MGCAQLIEGQGELTLHVDGPGLDVYLADASMGEAVSSAQVSEPGLLGARHGDDRPAGRLTEQQREGVHAVALTDLVQPDPGPDPVAQRRLRQRDGQATLGKVVCGIDETITGGVDQDLGEPALAFEVDARWQTAEVVVGDLGPGRATELVGRGAQQVDGLTGRLPA